MEHASLAVRRCPFLAQLAKEHGEDFATSIAIAPTKPVGREPLPTGTDAVCGLGESFRLFHGPQGLLPLTKGSPKSSTSNGSRAGCPYHALVQEASSSVADTPTRAPTRAAPFATISLSNFGKGPNFGDFFGKHGKNGKGPRPSNGQQRPQRPAQSGSAGKPPHGPANTSAGTSSSSGSLGGSSNLKPQRPLGDPGAPSNGAGRNCPGGHSKPPGAAGSSSSVLGSSSSPAPASWSSSSTGSVRGPSPFQQQRLGSSTNSGSNGTGRSNNGSGADSKGGRYNSSSSSRGSGNTLSSTGGTQPSACPLRKWLGPAAGLVFNQYDKLICPPPIVAARAALAKTTAVQQLRPQALPVKLVAVAAVVAGVNLPCGAVREHFEKFSVGWFVAVHATIPFVAMLRKAVVMPKYAMLVTIAAAVMGQVIGSRLERLRLRHEEQHGPLLQLPLPLPAVPSLQQGAAPPAAAAAAAARSGAGVVAGAGSSSQAGRSAAPRASSSDRHWWEKLAADPEPAVDNGTAGVRCGSEAPSGLFARLPVVKA